MKAPPRAKSTAGETHIRTLTPPCDNRAPAYLAVSPSGQVPALRLDDGTVLTEAAAILPLLAERYPEAGLGSNDSALGRYRLTQLERRALKVR